MNLTLTVNGTQHEVADVPSGMPLLYVLRDRLNLTGTKYGCGEGQCGACNVLVGETVLRSCLIPAASLQGQPITTIEGLSEHGDHPVQQAWVTADAPQCGYCQGGQVLAAVHLLKHNPNPSDADIDDAMSGVLCRCGAYVRIRKAIHLAAAMKRST